MKANEAPEKLYLHPTAKGEVAASWLTFPLTDIDIEYIRTDAFIKKAIKYVANHFLAPGMDNEIKDFVNYMKGE